MVFSVFCNFARSQERGKRKKKQYITLRHRYMANNETRDRIVESAIELFNRNGCKGVTMDDIAGSIHISKRTLYEVFANKNELVLACLKQVHCEIGQVRLEMFQKTDEPFLMTLYIMRTAALTNVRYSRLLLDAEKYYPELNEKLLNSFSSKLRSALTTMFKEASARGDLRDGVDIGSAVDMIVMSIMRGSHNTLLSEDESGKRLRETCFTFLRGLLSIPAIERYDRNEEEFKKIVNC